MDCPLQQGVCLDLLGCARNEVYAIFVPTSSSNYEIQHIADDPVRMIHSEILLPTAL